MEQIEWLQMLSCLEELHRFSRMLLLQGQKRPLTTAELEMLSILYLHPEDNTPLALSHRSGMKKEAVSRCLRQLLEKGCIRRAKNPQDERSYSLFLTEIGEEAMHASYGLLLQPLYDLRRQMGADFTLLFELIERGNRQMAKNIPPCSEQDVEGTK